MCESIYMYVYEFSAFPIWSWKFYNLNRLYSRIKPPQILKFPFLLVENISKKKKKIFQLKKIFCYELILVIKAQLFLMSRELSIYIPGVPRTKWSYRYRWMNAWRSSIFFIPSTLYLLFIKPHNLSQSEGKFNKPRDSKFDPSRMQFKKWFFFFTIFINRIISESFWS